MSKLRIVNNYNNYFNRIEKISDLASDYSMYSETGTTSFDLDATNFDSNDGITTKHIINGIEGTLIPDYILKLNVDRQPKEPIINSNDFRALILFDEGDEEVLNVEEYDELFDPYEVWGNYNLDLYSFIDFYPSYITSSGSITIWGEWKIENFSFKINELGNYNITIIDTDNNTYTISSSDLRNYYNGIINYELLTQSFDDEAIIKFIKIAFTQKSQMVGAKIRCVDYNTKLGIESRWFVIDHKKIRGLQYELYLKRDLIADYYSKVIESPILIDRAFINNKNNPLLYNPEGFSFNEIKKNEILLKDNSLIPYYVLYFKKGISAISGSYNTDEAGYDIKITTTIANSLYASGTKYFTANEKFIIHSRPDTLQAGWLIESTTSAAKFSNAGLDSWLQFNYSTDGACVWYSNHAATVKNIFNEVITPNISSLINEFNNDIGYTTRLTNEQYNSLLNANGKYIKDSDNKIYKVNVSISSGTRNGILNAGTARSHAISLLEGTKLDRTHAFSNGTFRYEETVFTISVSTEEVGTSSINWSLDWSTKQPTIDSDFNIIAIPYDDITYYDLIGAATKITANNSRLLLDSIIQASGDNLVDLQMIPYCPNQAMINPSPTYPSSPSNSIRTADADSNFYDVFETPDHNPINFIFYVNASNYSFNINQALTIPTITGDKAIDYKISNECDIYKIVSPNYNGSFEFSIAKNDGVDYFNVDITLIPYNPYIHINPNFKALYGADWNDSKGLLCGGDFSLPKYSDAWTNYQLQNKNYQQIFDRQVRNIDFNQRQERFLNNVSLGLGALQGGATGATAGVKVGGGWGALIGGVVGTGTSLTGGLADIFMMNERQAENKQLALDNFAYQLGNIKALPDTINKTTPLTFNNKKFPFIEVYSSTDEEKLILQNSIKYRSMKVNAIGTIQDYLQENERTFISGSLIRLENLGLDSQEAFEIYNELMKGVYI